MHAELQLDNQVCFRLYTATRLITQAYTPILTALGITYPQYLVLMVLWEKDGVTVGELCEKLMLDNGTLSPLLKKLQQEGYIEKTRGREDDRIVVVTLTEEGRALKEKAKDIPAGVAGCIDLPPEKAAMLYGLLYELLGSQKNNRK